MAFPPNPNNVETSGTAQPETSHSEEPRHVDTDAVADLAPDSAHQVLLMILSNLTSITELQNAAVINRGMYGVYKANEMQLLRAVLRNQCPAAWELREWTPPVQGDNSAGPPGSCADYTPQTYMLAYKQDCAVVERLKQLIYDNCQTFIRKETTLALSSPKTPNAQRINDAIWRIWCFCAIFGYQKNREDDIMGQLDWLKGGILATNQGCAATVNTNLSYDVGSVLLNAPEHFAQANPGGLNAAQLYDITEVWTCFTVLLQGYAGRTSQARQFGVFNKCHVVEGDVVGENSMLDEWISHLMALGPRVILEMALLASDSSPTGFALAQAEGWTDWNLPFYTTSRSNFLKEPVSKVYSESVMAAKLRIQSPAEKEQKEMSRKRVASMAAEIRVLRQNSEVKRRPLIDMNSERPMSFLSRSDSKMSAYSKPSSRSVSRSPSTSPSRRSTPSQSPPTRHTSYRNPSHAITPISEDQAEMFGQKCLERFAPEVAQDSGELAVRKIVSMGFTVTEARQALRITDDGESICLDRAVEYLLRKRQASL
jgi:hypothetical protein